MTHMLAPSESYTRGALRHNLPCERMIASIGSSKCNRGPQIEGARLEGMLGIGGPLAPSWEDPLASGSVDL